LSMLKGGGDAPAGAGPVESGAGRSCGPGRGTPLLEDRV